MVSLEPYSGWRVQKPPAPFPLTSFSPANSRSELFHFQFEPLRHTPEKCQCHTYYQFQVIKLALPRLSPIWYLSKIFFCSNP